MTQIKLDSHNNRKNLALLIVIFGVIIFASPYFFKEYQDVLISSQVKFVAIALVIGGVIWWDLKNKQINKIINP